MAKNKGSKKGTKKKEQDEGDDPFGSAAAGGGEGFRSADWEGHLVLFYNPEKLTVPGYQNDGEQDVADCDVVVVVDAEDGPAVFVDSWVFGTVMAPGLFKSGSEIVIGIVDTGEASQKGRTAPWILSEPSPKKRMKALKFHKKNMIQTKRGTWTCLLEDEDDAPF